MGQPATIMPRWIRNTLIGLVGLVLLLAAAVAILAATFDPNDYKPQLVALVQEKKQRTLDIPGEIKLTVFPKIGVDLGRLRISERNSKAEFASVEKARLSLALMPLLSKQLIVDRISVQGLSANLRRDKDGTTNFGDLLSQDEGKSKSEDSGKSQGASQARFDIDGVDVKNAHLVWDDRQTGRKIDISGLDLQTGKLANGVPGQASIKARVSSSSPSLDANLDARTGFIFDLDNKRYTFNKLASEVELKAGERNISLDLQLPAVQASSSAVDIASLLFNASAKDGKGLDSKIRLEGSAHLDLDQSRAQASLKGTLDESRLDAKLGLTQFSPLAYSFDVAIDKLDVDRYRSQPAAGPAAASGGQGQAEQPIDLSAIKDLNARGRLKVGELKAQNIRMSNVQLDLKAAGGRVDLNPMQASLYGGSLSGSASALAAKEPHIALRQTLSNVNVGPLLKDAAGMDKLEGRGNITLDVNGEGALVSQIRKSLAGSARLELRDGAVKGIDIAKVISTAKARLGQLRGKPPPQTGTSTSQDKTSFSELSGSFRINKGVAHNEDLRAKSPLLRLEGAGDVDIGQDRLNYLVKASVVNSLQGQGGPELQALKGLTVPVHLSGPFSNMSYKVDFGSVATDLVRKQLEGQLEGRRGDLGKSAEDQLKNGLKGLFGK